MVLLVLIARLNDASVVTMPTLDKFNVLPVGATFLYGWSDGRLVWVPHFHAR